MKYTSLKQDLFLGDRVRDVEHRDANLVAQIASLTLYLHCQDKTTDFISFRSHYCCISIRASSSTETSSAQPTAVRSSFEVTVVAHFLIQAAATVGVVEHHERGAPLPNAADAPGEVRRRLPAQEDR